MHFWTEFHKNIKKCETTKKRYPKSPLENNKNKKDKINIDQLSKLLLTWMVAGIVSLFPTFMQILISEEEKHVIVAFFSNKDLFLVITTLTISVMFETIFDNRSTIVKNVVVSMGILLVVISVHIFTLLQTKTEYDYFYVIGVLISSLCILNSLWGYVVISMKGVRKRDE